MKTMKALKITPDVKYGVPGNDAQAQLTARALSHAISALDQDRALERGRDRDRGPGAAAGAQLLQRRLQVECISIMISCC